MMEALMRYFQEVHFAYLEQFLTALLPMALTVVIHGEGMGLAGRYFRRFGASAAGRPRRASSLFVLVTVVAIMLATHYFEVVAWAIFYTLTGMLENFRSAMAFSINTYTTLGASNIQLHGRWWGFSGFEAMVAMLMFGWSTAVLAAVVQKTHSIEP